ncbi:RNA-guided endonuclease InsQ/TnpB family protein [Thermosporothrix hazakensis]|nr:RNA-guided endonuclease TnpB family protein [Thermosporothrix hazakensis]GCE45926.1 transposase [Thermosporothrix hazakensis]
MKVTRGYKTELDLNNKQRTACLKHAGCARFAYNWGLACSQEAYRATGKRPTAIDLHKELNALKKTDYPWMYEVSKCAMQEALRDLEKAYKNFFRRVELKKQGKWKGKLGFPTFKKKSKGIGSFRLTGSIKVLRDAVQLPRLGRMRLHEHDFIPTTARILSATVSEEAGRWFVSIQVEEEQEQLTPPATTAIGVDLGIKTLATLSDGVTFENPRALKHAQKRLRHLERQKSRRKLGSKNRKKTCRKLAKQHARIARIRKDAAHKLTTSLCKNHALVAIEDLHVAGMLNNHKLAQAVSDSNFGEIRRQLEYKAVWHGVHLVKIDRFYPSSKRCSACGWQDDEQTLADRLFTCHECGLVLDRDLNAAINILQEALRTTGSSSGSHAYGVGSSGLLECQQAKLPTLK